MMRSTSSPVPTGTVNLLMTTEKPYCRSCRLGPKSPHKGRSRNSRRLHGALRPLVALGEKCLFNLVTDADEPCFGLVRAVAKVGRRGFGFARLLFRSAQFGGERVGEVHRPLAIIARQSAIHNRPLRVWLSDTAGSIRPIQITAYASAHGGCAYIRRRKRDVGI
jgi:hypothetical protein